MKIFLIIFFTILNYLIGSIPNGYIIAKINKIDIQSKGSKNIGATNIGRVLGPKLGILVGFLDIFKGVLLVTILNILNYYEVNFIKDITEINILNYRISIIPLYGIFAVYGHLYSVFLKFKGGKGVSTSFALTISFFPYIGLLSLLIFFIILFITKYVSLSSLITTLFTLISSIIFSIFFKGIFIISVLTIDLWFNNLIYNLITLITFLLINLRIFIAHKDNIKRIISGTENEIKKTKTHH